MLVRNRGFRFLLFFSSTILTIFVIEGVLRLFYTQKADAGERFYTYVEYDRIRGWRDRPNADVYFNSDEYEVRMQFNSHGLRGPERSYRKGPALYRILILGDSFVEGVGVDLRNRFPEVLEKLLNEAATGLKFEVIAMGTAGYSTDQELLWLKSEGLRWNPDLVITMFYWDDVIRNTHKTMFNVPKPQFALKGEQLELTNVPVPRIPQISSEKSPWKQTKD